MYKITIGDRCCKALKSILLFPIWANLHILRFILLIVANMTSWIIRKVCYIAVFFDIAMVCITGEFVLFFIFLAIIGIAFSLPYIVASLSEWCSCICGNIVEYWSTPCEPKWHGINTSYNNQNVNYNNYKVQTNTNSNSKSKTNINAKPYRTNAYCEEETPLYSKCRIIQTPHRTKVEAICDTPEVIALPSIVDEAN